MKNLQFNLYQCGTGWRWGRTGGVGSKKSKLIPVPSRGVGLKSCPILAPLPLRDGENPHGVKWGRTSQVGRGKIAISSYCVFALFFILLNCETHKKLNTEDACNLLSCFILSLVQRDNNNCKYCKIRVARHGVRSIMCC